MLVSQIKTAAVFYALMLVSVANAEEGIASVYTTKENGTRTASGIPFKDEELTAAHKRIRPFGTKVRVTNLNNGKSVIVTITDSGPYVAGRIVDLSTAAARAIGMGYGLAKVRIEVVR